MNKVLMYDKDEKPILTKKTGQQQICYSLDAAESIRLGGSIAMAHDPETGCVTKIRPKNAADVKKEAVAKAKRAKEAAEQADADLKLIEAAQAPVEKPEEPKAVEEAPIAPEEVPDVPKDKKATNSPRKGK